MLAVSFFMQWWLALFPGARIDWCQVSAQEAYQAGLSEEDPGCARLLFRISYLFYRGCQGNNPCVLLDKGNAAFLAGCAHNAVFSYRLGLQVNPNCSLLGKHLELVRDQVRYPTASVPLRPPPASAWLAFTPWMLLAGELLFTFGCILATSYLMLGRRSLLIGAAFAFGVAGLLVTAWGVARWQEHQLYSHPFIVVAAEETPLLRGNGPTFSAHPVVPIVRRGMEAKLLSQRGEWVQIEFPGDIVGWLPVAAVLGAKP